MKLTVALLSILSVSIVGCSARKPPWASIEKEALAGLPPYYDVKVIEQKCSPITSIADTTLPEGSWQIDVKLRIRAREALYLPMADHLGYAELAANGAYERGPKDPFVLWGWSRGTPPRTEIGKLKARPSMHEFVREETVVGAEKDIWEKIIAERLGSSDWKFTKVRAEPALGEGLPKDRFRSSLVLGSPEQVREQARVYAAYEHESEQLQLIDQLLPEVRKLRTEGAAALQAQYDLEINSRIEGVLKKRMTLSRDYDARVSRIMGQGDVAHDNYATRERLIHAEHARYEPLDSDLKTQYASLNEERCDSHDRAKAEIERQIKALVVSHGIDH